MAEEEKVVQSGVEGSGPVAGDQEVDFEALLFGEDEVQSGEEESQDAADLETKEEPTEEPEKKEVQLPEDASKAFAKKWKAEKDKMREEILKEIEDRTKTSQSQRSQGAPPNREMSDEDWEKLADDLGVPVNYAKVIHKQQQQYNELVAYQRKQDQYARERVELSEAQAYANQMKQANSSMPDWNPDKLQEYRMAHYNRYGTILPWKEAYRLAIADAVETGDLTRQAQQETIRKIQTREQDSATGLKSPESKKLTMDDLSDEQFKALREDVLAGKYSRKD